MSYLSPEECKRIGRSNQHLLRLLFTSDEGASAFHKFVLLIKKGKKENEDRLVSEILYMGFKGQGHYVKLDYSDVPYTNVVQYLRQVNESWASVDSDELFSIAVLMDTEGIGRVSWKAFGEFTEFILANLVSKKKYIRTDSKDFYAKLRKEALDRITEKVRCSGTLIPTALRLRLADLAVQSRKSGLFPLSMLCHVGAAQQWEIAPSVLYTLFLRFSGTDMDKKMAIKKDAKEFDIVHIDSDSSFTDESLAQVSRFITRAQKPDALPNQPSALAIAARQELLKMKTNLGAANLHLAATISNVSFPEEISAIGIASTQSEESSPSKTVPIQPSPTNSSELSSLPIGGLPLPEALKFSPLRRLEPPRPPPHALISSDVALRAAQPNSPVLPSASNSSSNTQKRRVSLIVPPPNGNSTAKANASANSSNSTTVTTTTTVKVKRDGDRALGVESDNSASATTHVVSSPPVQVRSTNSDSNNSVTKAKGASVTTPKQSPHIAHVTPQWSRRAPKNSLTPAGSQHSNSTQAISQSKSGDLKPPETPETTEAALQKKLMALEATAKEVVAELRTHLLESLESEPPDGTRGKRSSEGDESSRVEVVVTTGSAASMLFPSVDETTAAEKGIGVTTSETVASLLSTLADVQLQLRDVSLVADLLLNNEVKSERIDNVKNKFVTLSPKIASTTTATTAATESDDEFEVTDHYDILKASNLSLLEADRKELTQQQQMDNDIVTSADEGDVSDNVEDDKKQRTSRSEKQSGEGTIATTSGVVGTGDRPTHQSALLLTPIDVGDGASSPSGVVRPDSVTSRRSSLAGIETVASPSSFGPRSSISICRHPSTTSLLSMSPRRSSIAGSTLSRQSSFSGLTGEKAGDDAEEKVYSCISPTTGARLPPHKSHLPNPETLLSPSDARSAIEYHYRHHHKYALNLQIVLNEQRKAAAGDGGNKGGNARAIVPSEIPEGIDTSVFFQTPSTTGTFTFDNVACDFDPACRFPTMCQFCISDPSKQARTRRQSLAAISKPDMSIIKSPINKFIPREKNLYSPATRQWVNPSQLAKYKSQHEERFQTTADLEFASKVVSVFFDGSGM